MQSSKARNSYSFELALSQERIAEYFDLRQQIFCEEQALFDVHDRDDIDRQAYPIVALANQTNVVGVVRIYEAQPRVWYGGRLGTHPEFRRGWRIGKGLIYKAVTMANAWGCDRFLATVQIQNVRFFTRLHWNSLEEIDVLGQPHHLMEADLAFYPASDRLSDQQRPDLSLLQVA